MLGVLLSNEEVLEMEYLLKREMDELLLDFDDGRIEGIVKRAMEERYQALFRLFARFAAPSECARYVRSPSQKFRYESKGQ